MTLRPWTTKDLATLEQLRLDGVSRRQIAVVLGRSETAIKDILTRYLCPLLLAKRQQWAEALCQPHDRAVLAAQFGVTIDGLKKAKTSLLRLGFPVWRCPHRSHKKEIT